MVRTPQCRKFNVCTNFERFWVPACYEHKSCGLIFSSSKVYGLLSHNPCEKLLANALLRRLVHREQVKSLPVLALILEKMKMNRFQQLPVPHIGLTSEKNNADKRN